MELHDERSDESPVRSYREAVSTLVNEFAWNPWFLNTYWPENEPRVRLMAKLALDHMPADSKGLDVGCANGYIACLFRLIGFQVTAVDTYDDEKRDEMFRRVGIEYCDANLNEIGSLSGFPSESFDFILLGEVFEHILNQPAGLLRSMLRLLRPEGLLILTTPNPSTIANAIRLIRNNYLLWGTEDFLKETKVEDGRVIDRGDIHYREYPAWVLRDLLAETGLDNGGVRYVSAGVAPTHSLAKRSAKHLLRALGLAHHRLFSSSYVIWGRKTARGRNAPEDNSASRQRL